MNLVTIAVQYLDLQHTHLHRVIECLVHVDESAVGKSTAHYIRASSDA